MMARHRSPTAGRPAVEEVPLVEASRFATIHARDPSWSDPENVLEYHRDLEGAFVRLQPPATASDAVVARVSAEVRRVARFVKSDPRPRPEIVPSSSHEKPLPSIVRAREVVIQLIDESYSRDRDALRAFCEEVMERVGM